MKLFKSPNRLWVAEQRDVGVYTLSGKVGAPGVPKAREFRSPEEALAFLEAQRDKRLADGFEVVDPDAGLAGPFTVDGKPKAPPPPRKRWRPFIEDVRTHVVGGFATPAKLAEVLDELVDQEDTAPDALRRQLQRTIRTERQALRSRPHPDPWVNDKLDTAFADLDDQGVIALQNAGFTKSDAWDDILSIAAERIAAGGPTPVGGCYYTFQDLQRAVRGEGLTLGFGALGDNDTAEIGRQVVAALAAQGVTTSWDGTDRRRIAIPPFPWYPTTPR